MNSERERERQSKEKRRMKARKKGGRGLFHAEKRDHNIYAIIPFHNILYLIFHRVNKRERERKKEERKERAIRILNSMIF